MAQQLVLLLGPFPFIPSFTDIFSNKFRALDATRSSLPLPLFLTTHANSVQALICSPHSPLTPEIINCLPSLQLVITTSVGIDHIDLDCCGSKGIAVANAGKSFTEDVADYAVGLLLSVLRKVPGANRYVRKGVWPSHGDYYPLGSKVGGKRVGIVGLGGIGSEVAKRLQAFGCIISYNSRRKIDSVSFSYYTNVRDLAANNDILILCCALTAETHHIINKDVLTALGKDGIVINVGRGALINEKELVQCLLQQEIGGACARVKELKLLIFDIILIPYIMEQKYEH